MSPSERYYELLDSPKLLDPVLVVSLEGWVDAGLGAAAAMGSLLTEADSEPIVNFDGEHYIDQRARRPVARIVDGVTTDLTWPQIQMRVGHDRNDRDVLFLVGPEPDFHWHQFVHDVIEVAVALDVRLVVGLGAFPAPTPHTRPLRLAATAPLASAELLHLVGLVQGELEVPAGVESALELGFGDAGINVIGLWARVPHYVAAMPFPEASAILIEGLQTVSGLDFDAKGFRAAADHSRRQVDDLVAANPEHVLMVQKLEESVDASEGNPLGLDELPTGDEIAAELEKFLRGEQ